MNFYGLAGEIRDAANLNEETKKIALKKIALVK